jgi:serine phosphatase RsbU (regulator of sigma subunit)
MNDRDRVESLLPDLDSEETLYVVDRDLNVVHVNEEWNRFAAENRGGKLLGEGWNRSLLENLSGKEKERWRHIYRLLLDERLPHYQEQFICSSPVERRIYEMRISPRRDEENRVAWLVHHTVRVDDRGGVVERAAGRLDELEDREKVAREYRRRVVEQPIVIPSFRVAGHVRPVEETGGDLVWHREDPDGTTDLVLADVIGHGTEAGRLATRILVLLDELTTDGPLPGETLGGLSQVLLELAPEDRVEYATGLFFRFRPGPEPVIACHSFGHHGPIFSRSGQVRIESGPPVGLVDRVGTWPENRISLSEHGTRFLIFSDGITEQFNVEGEMFDVAGLLEAFRERLTLPLDEMLRGIVERLDRFRGEALVKDDQTLLGLELTGVEAAGTGPSV